MSPRFLYIKLSQASVLLPVFTGLVSYRQLNPSFRILFYFFIASIGFEVQATVLKAVYQNNMPGLHLYTAVEFLTFSIIYFSFFRKSSTLRLFIAINAFIFMAVALTDAMFVDGIWAANELSRSYSSVSLICYSLIYFQFMFRSELPQYTSGHPMFWISSGCLLYFGANTLYFMLTNYLISKAANTATLSLFIHAAINIIANCLYAQSFRCFRKPNMAS